ncbi:hypothetical protein J5U22_01685 [Saccharolobus shibatae]|uniref:VapB-type antitoxin n=1 Tax=Saccharolobus shibatae TaxID=2286 RepID=A0A8F5BVB0_9CREN|nr:hypothetical protein J5U21_01772 [Saccharolobus shibatae]QXJ35138.1 hypothetical protein J5U22_01685 [Saccharolobus shibatae]
MNRPNPVLLSIKGKKFTKISPDEVEKISEEEQGKYEDSD